MTALCRECGESFPLPIRSGPRPQFCSDECRETHRKRYYEKWVADNRSRVLSEMAKRRAAFKAANPDYWKRYYADNKERRKHESREWFKANTEYALERQKQYAAARPEQSRLIGRKSAQTRRARKRLVFVEYVDPAVVFERDKGMCGLCKQPVDRDGKWHIDHVIPLARGGEHSYANSQLAHARCNQSKGARIHADTLARHGASHQGRDV